MLTPKLYSKIKQSRLVLITSSTVYIVVGKVLKVNM